MCPPKIYNKNDESQVEHLSTVLRHSWPIAKREKPVGQYKDDL